MISTRQSNEAPTRTLTEMDYDRIVALVGRIKQLSEYSEVASILSELLWSARVVPTLEVEHDVITLNSRVKIRNIVSGKLSVVDIAFPDEAGGGKRIVPITSVVGATLLGHREGDIVYRNSGSQELNIVVERVMFQPESTVIHRTESTSR